MKNTLCASALFRGLVLEIHRGSALHQESSETVIVNAANSNLQHRGGIAGQLVTTGGNSIQEESDHIMRHKRPLRPTEVVTTGAGTLQFFKIIHVVGPIWRNELSEFVQSDSLITAICNVLEETQKLPVRTAVLPLISSNTFGFPVKLAAKCHIQAFIIFAQRRTTSSKLKTMKLCLFQLEELEVVLTELLEFCETMEETNFYGLPLEQGESHGQSCCRSCQEIRPLKWFSKTEHCCKKICDHCVYQHSMRTCPSCVAPINDIDPNTIICYECNTEGEYEENYHKCRMICKKCLDTKIEQKERACVCGLYLSPQ